MAIVRTNARLLMASLVLSSRFCDTKEFIQHTNKRPQPIDTSRSKSSAHKTVASISVTSLLWKHRASLQHDIHWRNILARWHFSWSSRNTEWHMRHVQMKQDGNVLLFMDVSIKAINCDTDIAVSGNLLRFSLIPLALVHYDLRIKRKRALNYE